MTSSALERAAQTCMSGQALPHKHDDSRCRVETFLLAVDIYKQTRTSASADLEKKEKKEPS